MPIYLYRCPKCDFSIEFYSRLENHSNPVWDFCSIHGHGQFPQVLTFEGAHDWGNAGQGRYFEHVSNSGESFRDKASFKRYLKDHGLREHYG